MKRWLIILGLVALAGGGVWFYLNKTKDASSQIESKYDFTTVKRTDLSDTVDATGTVEFVRNSSIYPAYEAVVKRVLVKAGAKVKKGDLLMILDSTTVRDDWATQSSSLQQVRQNLAVAQKEYERLKVLYNAQGATITDLENAKVKVDNYQEDLKAARTKLDDIRRRSDGANFFDERQMMILIKAPIDSEVAWVDAKAGDKVTTTTLLMTLGAANQVEIEAAVDESDIDKVKANQPVTVYGNDEERTELQGVVTEIGSLGTEESSVVTFPIKIRVQNKNQLLKPGMSVDATVQTDFHPNVLTVPATAVVERRGKMMAPLWRNGQVLYVRVQTGVKIGTSVEITSGLEEGDVLALEKTVRSTSQSGQTNGSGNGNNRSNNRNFSPFGGGPPR